VVHAHARRAMANKAVMAVYGQSTPRPRLPRAR
jgi:hypothetical protein